LVVGTTIPGKVIVASLVEDFDDKRRRDDSVSGSEILQFVMAVSDSTPALGVLEDDDGEVDVCGETLKNS
jgi:hypothetical protein